MPLIRTKPSAPARRGRPAGPRCRSGVSSLLRLTQKGWITSAWGASENNRKAKFYSITRAGRRQLARETESWERIAGVIGRVLRLESQR